MNRVSEKGNYHRNIPENTAPDVVRPTFKVVSDPVIPITSKALSAYDRMFWAHLPHQAMARLNGFNSTALTVEFKNDVRKLLSLHDVGEYYEDPEEVLRNRVYGAAELDSEWSLLVGWKVSAEKSSPHHIVPHSRFWTSNPKNFRHVDRATHNDFHTVFSNLTPIEQLLHMVSISSDDFNPVFVWTFIKLLSETDLTYYYRKGVVWKRMMDAASVEK